MKIFSWVQNKFTSKKSISNTANHDHIQQPCKEEFSDWPHDGLLTIGTFGNNKIKQLAEADHKANLQEINLWSGQDHLTPEEEVGKLSKELNLIFHETEDSRNCSTATACSDDVQYSLVHSRGKDIRLDNNISKGAIGKKSLSFLLKKMFVCKSGFSPAAAPSLRDPILDSRMDKILRTILHRKIYPQSSSPKLSTKKSLEHIPKTHNVNIGAEKADHGGSKWVKTDSEYIVLEI